MKNQYCGDVNDYRKYGLLRALTGRGHLTSAICWMLTPNDERADGRFVTYLNKPEKWRAFDPDLFDQLHSLVMTQSQRDVAEIERANVLPGARFYSPLLPDAAADRERYFASFWEQADGVDLVFFDPDNGLAVKSKPYGRKGSSKYLYWPELVQTYKRGHAVLVYQHFPRVPRERFIANKVATIKARTGAHAVTALRTARVVFFLLTSAAHAARFKPYVKCVAAQWRGQIRVG